MDNKIKIKASDLSSQLVQRMGEAYITLMGEVDLDMNKEGDVKISIQRRLVKILGMKRSKRGIMRWMKEEGMLVFPSASVFENIMMSIGHNFGIFFDITVNGSNCSKGVIPCEDHYSELKLMGSRLSIGPIIETMEAVLS